ncbi:MAG: nicotinate-nucleotide adenylyltransferase [Candidatus Omnitrophica bacterium]|nr:nicotinate-nucleotide adenylyltransferase [Candidatus Omnitrophota bacterium]
MAKKNNLGILGGSFDPPHIGHLVIAETSLQQFHLQKIIFIPSGIPSHKFLPVAGSFDRFKMVELAIEDNPRFEVADIEIRNTSVSYTYGTVLQIRKKFKNTALFFILGSDAFRIIDKWKNIASLSKEVTFLIASRNKKSQKTGTDFSFPLKYFIINNPFIDVSSSSIRNFCREKKSIRYLVPEKVRKYIERKRLYE